MVASSLDLEKGITTPTFEKAEVKKQIIKSSEKVVLVTDSNKFNHISFAKICAIDDFDLLIIDNNIDKKTLERLKDMKNMSKPIIGIPIGDPAGIGPEIVVRALHCEDVYKVCKPVVIGEKQVQ